MILAMASPSIACKLVWYGIQLSTCTQMASSVHGTGGLQSSRQFQNGKAKANNTMTALWIPRLTSISFWSDVQSFGGAERLLWRIAFPLGHFPQNRQTMHPTGWVAVATRSLDFLLQS